MKKGPYGLTAAFTILVTTLAATMAAITIHARQTPAPVVLNATVETTEIDISAKIPGRILDIFFTEGTTVHKGDTLAVLESRELDAKVGQAQAALTLARAKQTLAHNGLRPQEKDAAEQLFLQAKAQADLMEKTWDRVQRLSNDSIISNQERDQAEAQFLAAKEAMAAADAKRSLAHEGSRPEDLAAAAALVTQAEQAYSEATAWRDEKIVRCPIDGEVARQIMHRGEIVGAGAPILTILDGKDTWVTLTIKENDLSHFRMGNGFESRVPALGDTTINLTITYLSPMADFATWRPTSQRGGFDCRTFEVHLRPTSPIGDLRAGMSVNIIDTPPTSRR